MHKLLPREINFILLHLEEIFPLFGLRSDCVFQVIILIGNKADLEAQRDVTYEEAKQFAEENGEEKLFCWAEKSTCAVY